MIESFSKVFEQKLKKLKHRLQDQLKETKPKRNKTLIKMLLKEAKDLRNTLKKINKNKKEHKCPHCGGILD